jgi:hypothetical protein
LFALVGTNPASAIKTRFHDIRMKVFAIYSHESIS